MKKYFKVTRKNKKIILGACVGTAVVLAVGLGVYIYTADHNTLGRKISIYGMDVSKLTVEEAEQKILNGFQEQKVDFEEDGAEVYEVTLGDLGYSLDADDLKTQLQDLQKKREETRRLLASQEDYRIAYQVNKDADQEKSALVSENFGDKERTASVDASVQYDGKQKKFVKYDNYKNYRFSGPDWYFFEHDASKPYPYGYSVKSLTQKKQEFAEWLKKYEEKA